MDTNTNLPKPGVREPEWYEPDNKAIVPIPNRTYTTTEKIISWLLVPLGYLFFRAGTAFPFGTMLLWWILLALTTVLLAKQGCFTKWDDKRTAKRVGMAVYLSVLPGSMALFFSANQTVHAFALLYCCLAYGYGVYAVTGNTLEAGLSDFVILELFRANFVYPCLALGEMPKAMGMGKGWKNAGRIVLRILGGLSLAFVPTLVVFVLLRYDRQFRNTIDQLTDFSDIMPHIRDGILGFLLAMVVFGLYAAATGERRDVITLDGCQKAAARVHVFSPVTSWAAVTPVLCLYIVFFVSQWENYLSAFFGILPEDFSYAAYAREGFFELCAIAVINLCILCATGLFTTRKAASENQPPITALSVRILHGVLSLCTLVLIATAMSKLLLYIDTYGLTVKRVYAAWLMAVLSAVFVLVIGKQFCPRLKLTALCLGTAALLWLCLGLANVEGRIADYNVERYLNGTLEKPEPAALAWELTEWGDGAMPAKVRAIKAGICVDTSEDLDMDRRTMEEKGFFAITLPGIQADKALGDE